MHSDSIFSIGSTHSVCQDYALANSEVAIVCDGCSSSEEVDVGARIIAHLASIVSHKNWMSCPSVFLEGHRTHLLNWLFALDIVRNADQIRGTLHLPQRSLDVTLLMAKIDGENLGILCQGDGVVVVGYKDGTKEVDVLSFPSKFPQYLSYEIQIGRREDLKQTLGQPNVLVVDRFIDGEQQESLSIVGNPYTRDFKISDLEYLVIMSDGASSFLDENKENISAYQIAEELTSFKNTIGQFIQRRTRSFLKEAIKRGWVHDDDLSVAGIYFD